MWKRCGVWLALSAAGASASAVPVFDNGVTDTSSYIVSDGSPGADQIVADDFVWPTGLGGLSGIQWRGTYGRQKTAGVDHFDVVIYGDDAGAIAPNPLYSFSPSLTRSGPDVNYIFTYDTSFAQIDLVAGQTYWLSIFENLPTDLRWAWMQGRDGNLRYKNSVAPDFTLQIPYSVDFRLYSESAVVSEPRSLWASLWGLAAACGIRRAKTAASSK